MGTLVIKNIGSIFTGDIREPFIDGPVSLFAEAGKIKSIEGGGSTFDGDRVIDAGGMTVCPGLIDSHSHPVFGDFTPRQSQLNFIESSLHGGVTSMISAGEVHLPGRPTNPKGTKALALLAHLSFAKARPAGVKVYGGALILEKGLEEALKPNLHKLGLKLASEKIRQQFNMGIGTGRSDLICLDENDNLVVLELKRGVTSDEAIGQVLRYMGWLRENVASEGQKIRGCIVTGDFDEHLRLAALAADIKLVLVRLV